jgi:uncharacterized protein (DUF983 family)
MDPRKNRSKATPNLSIVAILKALCPRCHIGKVTEGLLGIRPKCLSCEYSFYPESGFYLGAIAVGFLITAALTVPPMIILKILNVEIEILLGFPFIEFLFLGTFLTFYSKILWLHLEYQMSSRLDSSDSQDQS